MKMQIPDAFQLVRTRDLTMDDAMAVISARFHLQCLLNSVQHLIQACIPDGVDSQLHIVFMGTRDHCVHLVG